jgi:hypothetical protein
MENNNNNNNNNNEEIPLSLLDELELNLFRNILPILQPFQNFNNLFNVDPLIEYSNRDYQEASDIFLDMISNTYTLSERTVHKKILNIMCTEYYKSGCEYYPNFDTILSILCSEHCRCQTLTSVLNFQQIVKHYCLTEAYVPSCFEFEHILLFHTQMGRYPTMEECIQFIQNVMAFSHDPLQYYQNDKTHVPTLGVDKLPIIKGDDDTICALCQETCTSLQDCIQLKPCNHMFHSLDIDCLETTSIHTYLEQNNVCPLCKSRIQTDLQDSNQS